MPRLSCLIPLHRSRGFLPWIMANIDAHLALGAEVIVSDRHLLDDTTERLRDRYRGVAGVQLLEARDSLDWVANINLLIESARGDFLRIVPHDDTATADSTSRLVEILERHEDAALATGIVLAEDMHGRRIPEKDELNARESERAMGWSHQDALTLAFEGRFGGAFKGVVRSATIRSSMLRIRPTPSLAGSERLWLFGIALTGRFAFVPDSAFVKRYHPGSTHRSWRFTGQTWRENARVMADYCNTLVHEAALRESILRNIEVNSERLARWTDCPVGSPPPYLPIVTTDSDAPTFDIGE